MKGRLLGPVCGRVVVVVIIASVDVVDVVVNLVELLQRGLELLSAEAAAFVQAVEASLSVDATVTNVVATNTARRRLARRELLQSGVDVSYTLQMAIENGMIPSPLLFTSLHPGAFVICSTTHRCDSE